MLKGCVGAADGLSIELDTFAGLRQEHLVLVGVINGSQRQAPILCQSH